MSDSVSVTPTPTDEWIPLRCPYCGEAIEPMMEQRGGGYLSYEVVAGYECEDCYGAWTRDGRPLNGTRFDTPYAGSGAGR